ncbi:hypothetical protein ACVV4J_11645 [Escherichia coli]
MTPYFPALSLNHGVSSRAHHPIVVTGRLPPCFALSSGEKGEGRARLPSLYASFGKLGETPTHEDIIDNNRSINWPV